MDQRQPPNWNGIKFTPCKHIYQCIDLDPTIDGILACSVYKAMAGYSAYGVNEISFPMSSMAYNVRAGETQTRKAIKQLIQSDHVERIHKGGSNGRDFNRYRVLLPDFYREWMVVPENKLTDKQRIDRAIGYLSKVETLGLKEREDAIKMLVSIKKKLSPKKAKPKKSAASESVQDNMDIIVHDNPEQNENNVTSQDDDL